MADLVCTRCGMATSYADASIADKRKTCERERRGPQGRTVKSSDKHVWVEKMHPDVDVV